MFLKGAGAGVLGVTALATVGCGSGDATDKNPTPIVSPSTEAATPTRQVIDVVLTPTPTTEPTKVLPPPTPERVYTPQEVAVKVNEA